MIGPLRSSPLPMTECDGVDGERRRRTDGERRRRRTGFAESQMRRPCTGGLVCPGIRMCVFANLARRFHSWSATNLVVLFSGQSNVNEGPSLWLCPLALHLLLGCGLLSHRRRKLPGRLRGTGLECREGVVADASHARARSYYAIVPWARKSISHRVRGHTTVRVPCAPVLG